MSSLPDLFCTPEQYLEYEEQSDRRNEYFNGQIFAMAGSTPQHNRITVNVSSTLHLRLRSSSCQVFSIDVRVRVPSTDLYTYPDVAVVCGNLERDARDANTLVNPKVIVEVLSKSTQAYDRGDKFSHYQRIESLTDYILVAQDKVRVEHYTRQGSQQWLLNVLEDLQDQLHLSAINATLTLSDIYLDVDFDSAE